MRTPGTGLRRPAPDSPASGTQAYARPYAECTGRGCTGRFLAPTAVIGFGPDLFRVARNRSFGEANFFFLAAAVTALPVLGCGAGFEAVRVGGSDRAGSAISNPNRAATSLSSSVFAALGAAFVSVRSCP